MTVEKALKKVGEMKKINRVEYSKKIGNKRLNFFDNGGTGTITCIHIDYYNEDGTIADFDKAVQMWSEQGITKENEIAYYSGTGWRACVPWLMAYENGWTNVKLFDGGWFAWQMDETNPVQKITPEEAAARYN